MNRVRIECTTPPQPEPRVAPPGIRYPRVNVMASLLDAHVFLIEEDGTKHEIPCSAASWHVSGIDAAVAYLEVSGCEVEVDGVVEIGCSFCRKSRQAVKQLVAVSDKLPIAICDECVGVASKMIAADKDR